MQWTDAEGYNPFDTIALQACEITAESWKLLVNISLASSIGVSQAIAWGVKSWHISPIPEWLITSSLITSNTSTGVFTNVRN